MGQSPRLPLQQIASTVSESKYRRETKLRLDRARSELAETKAAMRKTINESQLLMADVDVMLARIKM